MLSGLFTGAGLAEDGSISLSSAPAVTAADLTSAQERRPAFGLRADAEYAGAAIHWTVVSGFPECTMAFHIKVGGDKQFLTAGHCGYNFSGNWVHTGITIGTDQADMYHDNGVDIMRIQLPEAQAGFKAIDAALPNHQFSGWATALVGTAVRTSRARTQTVTAGTITDQFRCWVSDTANPDIDVCGADWSLPSQPGDSGSSIYYPWQDPGGPPYLAAVGTLSNTSGNLAKVQDALSPLGFAIYTPCGDLGC